MKNSHRPGRLGVRSLTKKTVCLLRKLTVRTGRSPIDTEIWGPGAPPKLLSDSESSETLPSPNAYSASFEDFWSGISLRRDDGPPEPRTDGQLQAGFFARLPEEIRDMIYRELWRDAGLGQHIIRAPGGYAHSRCLLHREQRDDDPWESLWMMPDTTHGGVVPAWVRRGMSTWCDHWRCEEAREEREIRLDMARRRRTCRCVGVDTWTGFLPMLLSCKRMYLECAASIYTSLTFTITDVALARGLFSIRHRGHAHPLRRINLSFRRIGDEGRGDENSSFEEWVESWSAVLRLLDTPGLLSVNLWLDSDIYYERHWLSATTNVLRRIPEELTHKIAVSLPPDGHGERVAGAAWLRGLDELPLAGAGDGGAFRGDGADR